MRDSRQLRFLTWKLQREGLHKRIGRTDRSIMWRRGREKLRDRSLGGGDLVINLAGRSICSGWKNSICRVNTLCNGQRDICCRIVCPVAFLDQPFCRVEERKNYHVTLRSSEIQDRTYFPFFFLLLRVYEYSVLDINWEASPWSDCIFIATREFLSMRLNSVQEKG